MKQRNSSSLSRCPNFKVGASLLRYRSPDKIVPSTSQVSLERKQEIDLSIVTSLPSIDSIVASILLLSLGVVGTSARANLSSY